MTTTAIADVSHGSTISIGGRRSIRRIHAFIPCDGIQGIITCGTTRGIGGGLTTAGTTHGSLMDGMTRGSRTDGMTRGIIITRYIYPRAADLQETADRDTMRVHVTMASTVA